jgi:protein-S-isoprenylcysteine O-methyltransferase Ste14
MKKRLKINGFIMVLVIALITLFPKAFFRKVDVYLSDGAAEVFGIAFILLGQIFRASARGYKSENSQEGRILIQGGPYALVRNPMYLGILLIGLGIVLVLFEWWGVFIFLLVFAIRYISLIFKEEKHLEVLFPRIYPDYCKKVPRILPSLGMLSNKNISAYLPLKLSWVKKEIGSILTVLLITIFAESLEEIKSHGMRVYIAEALEIVLVITLFIYLIYYLIRRTNNFKKDVSN